MNHNNDLQQKIAELTAKHEWDETANKLFPDMKILSLLSNNKKRIVINCTSPEDFRTVMERLPVTNTHTTIGSSGKDKRELNIPYRLDIDNPCSPNQYRNFALNITYTSGEIEVETKLPIELISAWVGVSKRNISESEYHHFNDTIISLRKKQVTCYVFNGESINWYGGNKTLLDVPVIKEIITHLLTTISA